MCEGDAAVNPRWCIRDWFPGRLQRESIWTSEPVKATLLRSIKQCSENRKVADDLAQKRYLSSPDLRKYKKYQAHTRQAVAFYEAAEGAHYRVSPLLYYYSFSNFAEALIALAGREETHNHGITWSQSTNDLWKSTISLDKPARFQAFYRLVTGLFERDRVALDAARADPLPVVECPESGQFRLKDLCAYVSDINHEFENSSDQPSSRFTTCKLSILKTKDGQGYEGRMAVPLCGPNCKYDPVIDPQIWYILTDAGFLREPSPNEDQLLQIFGFASQRAEMYTFWKTPEPLKDINQVVNNISQQLRKNITLIPFEGQPVFSIDLNYPLSNNKPVRMNELLAI